MLAFFEFIFDWLLPNRCVVCDSIDKDQVCDNCLTKFKINKSEKILDNIVIKSFYSYEDPLRYVLHRIKFQGYDKLAQKISQYIAIQMRDFLNEEIDFAIGVPIHEARLRERGFNQVDLIFQELLILKNIEYKYLLVRTKNTPRLFELTKEDREEIIKDVFEIQDVQKVKDKNILILDDIFTTGTTIKNIANLLLKNGARHVFALTLCSGKD